MTMYTKFRIKLIKRKTHSSVSFANYSGLLDNNLVNYTISIAVLWGATYDCTMALITKFSYPRY